MRVVSLLTFLCFVVVSCQIPPIYAKTSWTLADCSRGVLRCGAELDACMEKVKACDAHRRKDSEIWATRLDKVMEAHKVERVALRAEVLALRTQISTPAPWWESPVVWGVVGFAVGGFTIGLTARYLGRD